MSTQISTEVDFFFKMIMISLMILIVLTFIVLGLFIAEWLKERK